MRRMILGAVSAACFLVQCAGEICAQSMKWIVTQAEWGKKHELEYQKLVEAIGKAVEHRYKTGSQKCLTLED